MTTLEIETFNREDLSYLNYYRDHINHVAGILNVSPGAIAGAIVEELHSRTSSAVEETIQEWMDINGMLSSHAELLEAYNAQMNGDLFTPTGELLHRYAPINTDYGPGGIDLFTAINLLKDYNSTYGPSDPLKLNHYLNDYNLLARDLVNFQSDATAKFAGLMIKEAEAWYASHAANWNSLTRAEKDGLIVFYYNVGRDWMNAKYAQKLAQFGVYEVSAQDTEEAAEYLYNSNAILAALSSDSGNPADYQHCFARGTLIETSDGRQIPIEDVKVGDWVAAFDPADGPSGALVPRQVTRLFSNVTTEWLQLTFIDRPMQQPLVVTPGHQVLSRDGSFSRISDLLERGHGSAELTTREGEIVEISGRPISFTADTADLYEHAEIQKYGFVGSVALKPEEAVGWKTYNFEVEGLHTYIAGGIRVHNDSRHLDQVVDSWIDADGSFNLAGVKGNSFTIVKLYDADGDGTYDHSRNVAFGNQMDFVAIYELDENGQPKDNPKLDIIDHAGRIITGAQIGEIFGSTIGTAIVGENQFAQIAAGSVLAAVLGNVGQAIDALIHNAGRDVYETAQLDVMGAVKYSFASFGKDLFNQVKSQGIGAISGFLASELGEAIGVGGGFGGQLFNTVASKSVGHLVTTAAANIANGAPVFHNLLNEALLGNLVSGIGSFVGGYLGREVVTAETQAGAIGGSIGSAIGATIGTGIAAATGIGIATAFGLALNFALPGIGAFVGVILGTLIGDLFGEERKKPKANADATLYFADGHFYAGYSDRKHDGNVQFARAMNERARVLINGYIDLIGGLNSNSVSPIVRTGHNDGTVYAKVWNQDTGTWEQLNGTADEVVEWATFKALKLVDIQGGDIYLKRAVASSQATNLRDFLGDLKIAEDYRTYLENKATIDAIIASDPKSVFAAGWIVTLVRAEELGITTWQKSDFNGGLKGFLHSMGLETLGGAYEMTPSRLSRRATPRGKGKKPPRTRRGLSFCLSESRSMKEKSASMVPMWRYRPACR